MSEPRTERLLRDGLEAAFATSGGNVQTPAGLVDFLRVAYLPAIEAEARADVDALTDAAREVVRIYGTDRTWSLVYRARLGSRIDELATILERKP